MGVVKKYSSFAKWRHDLHFRLSPVIPSTSFLKYIFRQHTI